MSDLARRAAPLDELPRDLHVEGGGDVPPHGAASTAQMGRDSEELLATVAAR